LSSEGGDIDYNDLMSKGFLDLTDSERMIWLLNIFEVFLISNWICFSILPEVDRFKDLEKLFQLVSSSLQEYDWFKYEDGMSIADILKQLVNQLIVRNPANHSTLTSFIIRIYKYDDGCGSLASWVLIKYCFFFWYSKEIQIRRGYAKLVLQSNGRGIRCAG
jgi:hypothetical protein